MPTESTTRTLPRRLLRVVLGADEVADRDLLARFVASRDEEAFAELVRRHGPMVLGVCRRVTGRPHDAEDAFQAAFIVLARRAGQLRTPEQLANWLYGVAYRTALEARAARRRVQEHPVSAAPEPAAPQAPDDTTDLRSVIDEELAKLPDKYRAAVVLCELEGVPRAEAAVRLKIPEGTLSSRLAYARKLLAERLSRRGVTAGSGVIATVIAQDAVAAVPRTLVTLTAKLATRAATTGGGAVPPDLLSPSVSTLADGVLKAMLVNRLRLALGAVVACGLLGLGAYGIAQVPAQNGSDPFNAFPPPRVDFKVADPVTGEVPAVDEQDGQNGQPKAKQPKKVAAKGIEDDDVPHPASPSQAVVRVEDGKLIVRQRGYYLETVTQLAGNQLVTGHRRASRVHATTYDPADVSVFDMKGNRLQPKAWKEKLKADVHVLVSIDGRLPQPRELVLFKEDTLFVVLPAPATTAYGTTDLYGIPTTPLTPATPARTVPGLPALPGQTAPPVFVPGAPAYPAPPRVVPPSSTRPAPARPATPTPVPPGPEDVPAAVTN